MSDEQPGGSGEIVIYETARGVSPIRVLLHGETVWLTQAQIGDLYETTPQNITQHLKAIYAEGEQDEAATCKNYLQVRREGGRDVSRRMKHYSLEAILAVGYRVRSTRGTEFRQWATARLSEYLVKGFTLDDDRLKGVDARGDYFDELLARIRDIRASEARVYQRIREIFAMAVDYREGEQETQLFFATMQNKMHFAATGLTAAEIIRKRADAASGNMGLTSWKGGKVYKRDVGVAKNYLDEREIDTLNRITVMFLDQAEFRAMRRQDIRMGDWAAYLDSFLGNNELPVLDGPGRISQQAARDWAELQYETFAGKRREAVEEAAETKYLEDLTEAARTMEMKRMRSEGDQTRGLKK